MNERKQPLNQVTVGHVSGSTRMNRVDKNGQHRTFKAFSFQRNYKDSQTKQWKHINSFTFASLGSLIMVIILIAVKDFFNNSNCDQTGLESHVSD